MLLGETPTFSFDSQVRVTTDQATPLPDVAVTGGGVTALTDARGETVLRMRGRDGERREVTVRCPPEYQSPPTPLVVSLRRLTDSSKRLRYEVICSALKRTVVVAARLDNGPNLPLMYLGKEIARTDGAGAAHALLKLPLGEPFRLVVDTSGNGRLRPQTPTFDFPGSEADGLLLLDQSFTVPRKRVHRAAPAGPPRPTRL